MVNILANNLTVTHNATIGGVLTVGGHVITGNTPKKVTFITTATANQKSFNVNVGVFTPELVTRNGLVEIPGVHYSLTGNVMTFSSPCRGGEMVYAYWNTP